MLCHTKFFVSQVKFLVSHICLRTTRLFTSNTFVSNARQKLAKNQATKNRPDVELLLIENYLLSAFTLSSKNNRRYSTKCTKNKFTCFSEVI